jgi:hypothetical protein
MKKTTTILGTFLVAALLVMSRAEATTVQYMLDQSNTLEDGIDYLLVTITEEQRGRLDFLVEPQAALTEKAGKNFGIASFGFNLDLEGKLPNDNFLLPDGWKVQFNKGMSQAGIFDVRIMGTGQARQDPLQFSVLGLELEDIIPGFASHAAGFEREHDGHEGWHDGYKGEHDGHEGWHDGHEGWHDGYKGEHDGHEGWHDGFEGMHGDNASSAFFYGDRLVSAVPVPAAFWLFGSGMLLLGRIATRRRT